jgi:saccharopine dehydrogenase (NAD+, L-lysine forming)
LLIDEGFTNLVAKVSVMQIGILRETKQPPDKRVPLTPQQCVQLKKQHDGLVLVVQPSDHRCFSNDEYLEAGIELQENLSDCDVLLGVKEVEIGSMIGGKTYLFFSHTAKEQSYNRKLLRAICEKLITLVDYEYLTRQDRTRVVAFGRWAGIVGAYNGLIAYGRRSGRFNLRPAWQLSGLDEMNDQLRGLSAGNIRIALTGGGRVARGAVEILTAAGIREVTPDEYLTEQFSEAVFCRLDPWHYTRHKEKPEFDFDHFVAHPDEYENAFLPYAKRTDLYMACHFWDPDSPVLLSREDLQLPDLPLRVIADISCDIDGPIASTVRPSTIADPLYGYENFTGKVTTDLFAENVITVMAVDNLPGELPRDASADFGDALVKQVIPCLLEADNEGIVERATIVRAGSLTPEFSYLKNYLEGIYY